jgi:putative glutamine amidotransferase
MTKIAPSFRLILVFLITVFLLSACSEQEEPLKIALSKGYPYDSYKNYYDWVATGDSTIIVEDMYNQALDSALKMLEECSALLLSGGADIYPGRYGKETDLERCGSINYKRDTLEFALIKKAMEMEIPIFGICRGQQMLNVAMGGSLYIDIPTDYDTIIKHREPSTYDCFHDVYIEPGTKLSWATGIVKGNTNSNHHQAINSIADIFKVAAKSEDGLIEAIEWKDPEEKAFLMAVQWHPERMLGQDLSKDLLELFLE